MVLPCQIVWIEEGLYCYTEVDKVAEVQHVQLRLDGRVLKIPEKIDSAFKCSYLLVTLMALILKVFSIQ